MIEYYEMLVESLIDDDELMHKGVKGMKWKNHVYKTYETGKKNVKKIAKRIKKALKKVALGTFDTFVETRGGALRRGQRQINRAIKKATKKATKLKQYKELGNAQKVAINPALAVATAAQATNIASERAKAKGYRAGAGVPFRNLASYQNNNIMARAKDVAEKRRKSYEGRS